MAIDAVHVTLESLQAELSTLRTMLKSFPCRYAWLADLPMTDMDNPFPNTLKIAQIGGRKNSLRDNAGRLFADLSYTDSLSTNRTPILTDTQTDKLQLSTTRTAQHRVEKYF